MQDYPTILIIAKRKVQVKHQSQAKVRNLVFRLKDSSPVSTVNHKRQEDMLLLLGKALLPRPLHLALQEQL